VARFLFLVKYRVDSAGRCAYDGTPNCFGGLYHSALFVVQMLNAVGIWAKLVQVCDANDIDREVHKWKPTCTILEALWIVPSKFAELQKLHPSVKWVVRCHSEIPFLAYEGIAMNWLTQYVGYPNVAIANNSSYGTRDFDSIIGAANPKWTQEAIQSKVFYLPNWYSATPIGLSKIPNNTLDVGCFGAIRPLKNQLIQALAAIEWAKSLKQKLHFHINSRTEQGGEPVVKNIKALMAATGNLLIEHPWEQRGPFLETMAEMDVSMQVSFSETFDITAADSVVLGVPLVTSDEVVWSNPMSQAVPTNTASIIARLVAVTGPRSREIAGLNLDGLRSFSNQSEATWKAFAETVS
jgi:hypothetical protein